MNNADANLALLLLDRLDVSTDDDERVDQIIEIVRGMSSDRVTQAAEIARLSAALSEALAQLEAERARNSAKPVTPADVERQYQIGIHIGSGLPRATCPCGFCAKYRDAL